MRTLPPRLTPESGGARALDIGCGAGRHTLLLAEHGFAVDAVDFSREGLNATRVLLAEHGYEVGLTLASAEALPFADETFDVVLSYGVFYYGTPAEGRAAIGELFRVLRPAGRAFVVVRTTDDYRYGKGVAIEPRTFRCEIEDTNERGMVIHFLTEQDVEEFYGSFGQLSFELTETTFAARTATNSDWLITVEK